MIKTVTLVLDTIELELELDIDYTIVYHDSIKVDVGVGDGLIVEPSCYEIIIKDISLDGESMPQSFINKFEENLDITDFIDE